MTVNQKNIKPGQQDDFLRIQDLLYLCLARWQWFVLSLAVTIGAATAYLLRTPTIYTRTASVLIKEDSKGKSVSSDLESFSEFGLFQSGTNVNNELITFQSPALMTEVVKRLRLDMNYFVPGKFHRQVAYGLTLPVDVTISDLPENESAGFTLEVQPDSTLLLSDFTRNGTELDGKDIKGNLLDSITTPLGKIIIHITPNYVKGEAYTLYVGKSSLYNAVNSCSSNLSVSLNNEKASVIDLSFKDNSTQRAEDVLSMLISVYNENWVKDKNQIAVSTSMFINERLGVIERELGNVDEDISSYKSEHLLPDVQAASSMYMAQSSATNAQILALNNQLYMTRYIRNYLANDANRTQLLPANSGIESVNIESQIAEYNKQLLQRNSLVANSSAENPLVVDMDQALASMRGAIIRSIDNQIVTLNSQIKSLRQTEQQTTSRIAANPTQAKYLLSVERQQKVKEALYLFLLQKREENAITLAATANNGRIIEEPLADERPVAPKRMVFMLAALILGLAIPVGIVYLHDLLKYKIENREDVEAITGVAILAELPLVKKTGEGSIVVRENKNDLMEEMFRGLRTNLLFMLGKDERVILFSSTQPGEGKSFVAGNLAVSLAYLGKRVVVVGMDIRKPGLNKVFNISRKMEGITNYLSDPDHVELFDMVQRSDISPNLDILPGGPIPPNPTELVARDVLERAIARLKERYDYVILDTAPIGMVTDTAIIGRVADMCVYVCRADVTPKAGFSYINVLRRERKFPKLATVINGLDMTKRKNSYGYGYGKKYGYGKGYGYGYGYGYGFEAGDKKK